LAKIEAEDSVLFREVSTGVQVAVQLTLGSSADRLTGLLQVGDSGLALRVAVSARAKEGEANMALIRLLAKTWRVPKSSVSIASGWWNRKKVVHIAGEPNSLAIQLNG
jgi:uncharacterized protein (TIGR00251 family)